MGDTIYAYKGQYWKPIYDFQYTGEAVPFTLNPGKYLLMCYGAQGGLTKSTQATINYGGVAYGVLNLKEQKEFYAVVGGNGGDAVDNSTPGVGGFNGGAPGGFSFNDGYNTGAGGGGASDIRTSLDDTEIIGTSTIPDEYQRVEYIENNSNHYINTHIQPSIGMKIVAEFKYNEVADNTWFVGSVDSSYNGIEAGYYTNKLFDTRGFSYSPIVPDVKFTATANIDSHINYDIYLFARNVGGGINSSDTYPKGNFYRFTITGSSTILMDLIPCYRKADNKTGMYDLVSNEFFVDENGGEFILGPELDNSEMSIEIIQGSVALNSRLIVAGGAGGSINMGYGFRYAGNGGGIVGGFVESGSTSLNYHSYADQKSGYSFGNGMIPVTKTKLTTSGTEGASGGGGGWYGGYANGTPNVEYSSSNGGGGSGYVLTKDSYKPPGYQLGEEYYLTDTFLCGGLANHPQILVCKPVTLFNNGDTIIFPCIGETENVVLPKGKFKLKCYGGDGGCRYIKTESPRGGYVEGILDNPEPVDIFVNVGGTGIGTMFLSAIYANQNNPTTMFNGGGSPGVMGSISGGAGGGASDIRIGEDSLHARVIVAGGAGGNGAYLGGTGGGVTGGTRVESGYGTSPGPGTQSSTPTNTQYPTICGGFGYGGNGYNANSGYGGAGGGGWYGGSGTYPDGSGDDDKGGSGGSGYVLTADSYKPEGYLLGEEYYLTDTVLTTGGNTLPIGHTEVVIEVLECSFIKILCRDKEGCKRFDETENKWIVFSQNATPEMFMEYGSYNIKTDEGLLNKYEILIYDEQDKISDIQLNVVPIEQTIVRTVDLDMNVSRIVDDAEYDPEIYSVRSETVRSGIGSNSKITLKTYIKKKKDSQEKIRLYCTRIYSK